MGRWLWMTGGLVVWAVHFSGVYALASLADVVASADAFAWRMGGLAFSAACLIACIVLFLQARRTRLIDKPDDEAFDLGRDLALLSALVSAVAIFWQSAPLLIGH